MSFWYKSLSTFHFFLSLHSLQASFRRYCPSSDYSTVVPLQMQTIQTLMIRRGEVQPWDRMQYAKEQCLPKMIQYFYVWIRRSNYIMKSNKENLCHSPYMTSLNITLPCVNAPTTAGTRNPGIVAAILVIPINTPKIT